MVDDPAGYRYVECDPEKINAAKGAAKAAAKANEGKPTPKAGWQESPEEFAARMAVENAKTEEERAAARTRADTVRRGEDRKRAKAEKERAASVANAEAEFRQAAKAGQLGAWRYMIDEEKMGGGSVKFATTQSKNEVSFRFPYQGRQRATLQLRAHPRFGRDVILSIEKGQMLCEYDGCSVTVRFGDGKPQRFRAARSADQSSNVLFIRDHDRFAASLKRVELLMIEARIYQEGNEIFEFDAAGLKWPFSDR